MCNNFLSEDRVGKENLYPLRLNQCTDCELLQLDHTVPKETMFGDHCYLSGMTQTLKDHFYDVADENVKQFEIQPSDLVVDIGGNDGSQLHQYQKCGIENVLNVECAQRVSEISRKNGVKTITEYFNKECVQNHIGEKTVKLFNASGVFFHLEELHSVIDGIKLALRDDGVLIVQFMYAGTMVEKLNFDTIYHEHLCYYTMRTSRYQELLEKDKKYTPESFKGFADKVQKQRSSLKDLLEQLKSSGKTIYAYGAPAKGNTLLNYFGISVSLVDKAVEINELKIGNYLPQSHIPIERETEEDTPDYYLLLSHNFADEIIEKNKELIDNGTKFIIPFPQIEIVG